MPAPDSKPSLWRRLFRQKITPVYAEIPPERMQREAQEKAEYLKRLRDPVAESARDFARALGRQRNRQAVPALIEVLKNQDSYFNPIVRAAAAASLGLIGDEAAVLPLTQALRDVFAEVSCEAANALGNLRSRSAIEPLIEVLNNSENYFLISSRLAAAVALTKFGDTEAVVALRKVADAPDCDPRIRKAVLFSGPLSDTDLVDAKPGPRKS